MAKKPINPIWIILAIVISIALLQKFQFLGAVITTCDNTEPNNAAELSAYLTSLNGTVIQLDDVAYNNLSFNKFNSNSVLGELSFIETGNIPCQDYLNYLNKQDETSSFLVLSKKQTLLYQGNFYWCNYLGTTAMVAADSNVVTQYIKTFETCKTVETPDNIVTKPNVTTSFEEPAPVTAPTPTVQPSFYEQYKVWIWTIGIIVLVSLIYYFGFERGPDRGFFRRK